MKKEGWVRISLDLKPNEMVMLDFALQEQNIEIVHEPEPNTSSRFAGLDKKTTGHRFFIPINQIQDARLVIDQFLEDFKINRSKVVVEGE